jgi:hypothetical protein
MPLSKDRSVFGRILAKLFSLPSPGPSHQSNTSQQERQRSREWNGSNGLYSNLPNATKAKDIKGK